MGSLLGGLETTICFATGFGGTLRAQPLYFVKGIAMKTFVYVIERSCPAEGGVSIAGRAYTTEKDAKAYCAVEAREGYYATYSYVEVEVYTAFSVDDV